MFQTKKILIVVKTYPNPSSKYKETVCIAGVLLENPPSWVRLYPVPFRDLPYEQRFKKYQIIEAAIKRNPNDSRPESHKVVPESIEIIDELGTERKWEKRKEILMSLVDFSMCEIQQKRETTKQSLGIFKPIKVRDFIVEPTGKDWTKSQQEILSQMDMFKKDSVILEKIPYKFKIQYTCSDSKCNGHNQTIIDWETSQLYRNLRKKFDEQRLISKMKEKYLEQVCGPDRDVYFIVGNQFGSPLSFLILSIFWPPLAEQSSLF